MKEKTLYQCEICGTEYAQEDNALKCESSHRAIESVVPKKYRSLKSNPSGYPDRVLVTFDDGEEIEYTR